MHNRKKPMKISLICFSLTGQETGEKLCQGLKKAGMTAELDRKVNICRIPYRSAPLHGQEKNFPFQMLSSLSVPQGSQSAVLRHTWHQRNQTLQSW